MIRITVCLLAMLEGQHVHGRNTNDLYTLLGQHLSGRNRPADRTTSMNDESASERMKVPDNYPHKDTASNDHQKQPQRHTLPLHDIFTGMDGIVRRIKEQEMLKKLFASEMSKSKYPFMYDMDILDSINNAYLREVKALKDAILGVN